MLYLLLKILRGNEFLNIYYLYENQKNKGNQWITDAIMAKTAPILKT